jgi:molybdate transport system regulatory protein
VNQDSLIPSQHGDASHHEEALDHQRLYWLLRAASVDVLPVRTHEVESAHRAVLEMNNLAGEILAQWIEGDIGSGIRLTARGRRLSVALSVMRQTEASLLKTFGGSFADDLRLLDRVTVRTSARNQFFARVEFLRGGDVQDEAVLQLPGSRRIVATVTRNSVETLGLKPGIDVVALIKASSMRVTLPEAEDAAAIVPTAINRLDATVRTQFRDQCYTELVADLGDALTAIAVSPSAEVPKLQIGQRIVLHFASSAIIVGVPA